MKRGMTLIELLLYTGLLAIIITVLYQLFIVSSFQRVNAVVEDAVFVNARAIMRDFNLTIRAATSITAPLVGVSSTTLSLSGGQVVYSVSPQGALERTEGGVPVEVTNGDVLIDSITFTQLGPSTTAPTVKIVFTLLGRHLQETGERRETFQTAVTLRQ